MVKVFFTPILHSYLKALLSQIIWEDTRYARQRISSIMYLIRVLTNDYIPSFAIIAAI